jgi:glycosyltransferase involved in cell wall biosynthesis
VISKIENPDGVTSAEIVVGIPSYNEADSIAVPTEVADEGLLEHFADYSSVIVNVDNHSSDGTEEAFLNASGKIPKIYVSTPEEVKGKGHNLRNLFEVAAELKAKAIVTVDADLKSMTPSWIQHLAEPLFDGYDYVVPIYTRHKYDGTITKNIAYPLVRTLYGLRVRQPIGGDFGVSGRLARCYLVEKTWSEDVSSFGIDIWMTTIAIGRNFKVCQTFMGSPKIHRTKDPASDLGPMFCQVVGAIFQLMMDFEFLWKDTFESRPSTVYGFGLGDRNDPPDVKVTRDRLHDSFLSGAKDHQDLWKKVLSPENWKVVQKLKKQNCEEFHYSTDVWAHILFDFAIAYRSSDFDRAELLNALMPFYYARTLSFVNKTRDMDSNEAEGYMENISRVFEEEKYYLVQRWDQSLKEHGVTKVADLLASGSSD